MIRLVQRRLIIPRGDTGTFSVPVLSSYNSGDAAVFSIIDPKTQRRVYNQLMYVTDNVLSVKFEHGDTVNLPVGKFLWDIKFYQDPVIDEGQVVSGKEVDSYYAAFSMPECEVRQTGDNMLTADDAPGSTLTPQHINAISAALFVLNEAVEKTETNVTHYPTIIDGEWNVWDANLGDYTTTGIEATGNGIASIEKTNTEGLVDTYTVNFTDGTTFLYDITNGSSISSITKQSTSGLVDTYVIIYTDGNSTTFTVTNGATPNISIGTVQEGPIAAASITGSAANPVLNLTLPNANVPTRVSELENDAGYLNLETDPTVPQWAKQSTKPAYTAQEVGALPVDTYIPEKTSDLVNDSNYAVDANYVHTDNNYTIAEKNKLSGIAAGAEVNVNADWNAVSGDAQILNKPTRLSAFLNDEGYLTEHQDISGKQDKLTFDSTPTANSTNPVTSGGVYNAIANINTMNIHICAQGEYNAETGVPTIQNPDTQTFYLVPGGEGSNLFIEWAYVNNAWERFGSADVDLSNYVQKTDYATGSQAGIIKVLDANGITTYDNTLLISSANKNMIMAGEDRYHPIVPYRVHTAAFYGLAKAAGDITQSQSNNAIGTYTDEAKAAIQQMLDVPSTDDIPEVPVQDVQVNGVSVLDAQGVANVPYATPTRYGIIKIGEGLTVGSTGIVYTNKASEGEEKTGTNLYKPIVPNSQHISAFYGLAKAAGADMKDIANTTVGQYPDAQIAAIQSMLGISQMLAPENPNLVATQAYAIGDVFAANGKLYKATAAIAQDAAIIPDTNCVETTMADESVRDVQVNGVSVSQDGVANVPIASDNNLGVVKINNLYGIVINRATGAISTRSATTQQIKEGTDWYRPITPYYQHESTFYGLSKVAGVDLANETVTLGTYPETAKTAIRSMIGATSSNVIAVQDTQPTDPDTKIWLPETAETPVTVPTVAEMNAALEANAGLKVVRLI